VELASRLYAVEGWGTVRADGGVGAGTYRYGAKYIPEGSPNLEWHPNGSGYIPVPGDLIVETNNTFGHVAIVDSLSGATVSAVEQNASSTGRHNYMLNGSMLSQGYGTVRGVEHAAANTLVVAVNGVQMLLDSAGQIWAKNTIGNGGWTLESPGGEKAIATA